MLRSAWGLVVLSLVACRREEAPPTAGGAASGREVQAPGSSAPRPRARPTFRTLRGEFETNLTRLSEAGVAPEQPPAELFQVVRYTSPRGQLPAYLTPDPGDGKRHPAIVWLTGGEPNTIGDVWTEPDPSNEQSAAAYRQAGIIMMFPSLRGGNANPGHVEGFLGEVDDVIAAADHLASQPYVNPKRIYLGGHSTGGTLALLVAEASARFRAVFSFGPVARVSGYGEEYLPCDTADWGEVTIRSPAPWLEFVTTPTFVIEGTTEPSNIDSLRELAGLSRNSNLHFVEAAGVSHFSVLAPGNQHIARAILKDDPSRDRFPLTTAELSGLYSK